MIDRLFAIFLLILLSPILLVISIFIYLENGFPIYFCQKRVGIGNTFFMVFKFRTMKKFTPNLATHLLDNPEQYILKSGNILRKYSLDELLNLINIVKGEMVFVGPRPALYNQYDLIEMRKEAKVDTLKPGITGWAQVNGRDLVSQEVKVKFEKEYVENRSFKFNVVIILKTFSYVIFRKGIQH